MTTNSTQTIKKLENHRPIKTGLKRYTLVIPEGLFEELQRVAERDHTSVLDLVRRSLKLGIIASDLEHEQGAYLTIEREGGPKERILFLT
jgi:hypothetical protein